MQIELIWYPKCSTCQKAKAWLDTQGISCAVRDIKLQKLSEEELRVIWQKSGLPLKRLFNTSGLLYKELGLKDQLPLMGETEQLALLGTDGMLVKRPLLVYGNIVRVGFKQTEWAETLGNAQQ